MADLTQSGVTVLDTWTEGNVNGKRRVALRCQVALSGAGSGATSNKIPASAFGLKKVEEVSLLVNDDSDLVIAASPNYAGTEIILKAAGTNAPASYTDTFRCIVKGETAAFYS